MKQTGKTRQKSYSLISAIIVTLVLLIGLSLLLYPTVADYINSLGYKKDIGNYQREVQKLDDSKRQEMLQAARDYNSRLLSRSTYISELDAEQKEEYDRLLDTSGNGMIGYVEIEKVRIYLPIYHGTKGNVLQSGVGHIEGSSLPVGGTGTHAILSGHTGLPSSKLFSNIDRLKKGDTFELHILGEVLTYQVESTVVLTPEEAEKQKIDPERDLCTLMTCTPYGINSHRLLVTGVRIELPPEELPNVTDPIIEEIPAPIPPVLWIVAAVLTVAVIAGIVWLIRRKRRRKEWHDAQGR